MKSLIDGLFHKLKEDQLEREVKRDAKQAERDASALSQRNKIIVAIRSQATETDDLKQHLEEHEKLLMTIVQRLEITEKQLKIPLKEPEFEEKKRETPPIEQLVFEALDEDEILEQIGGTIVMESKFEGLRESEFENLQKDLPYTSESKVRRRVKQLITVPPPPPEEWEFTGKAFYKNKAMLHFGLNRDRKYPVSSSSLLARAQYRDLLGLSVSGIPPYFDDLHVGLFTWSLRDKMPIYVYNMPILLFNKAKAVLTNYIGSMMSSRQRSSIRTTNATRLYTLTDPKYIVPHLDDVYKFARNIEYEQRVKPKERAKKQQLYTLLSTLSTVGSMKIKRNTEQYYETYDRKVTILDSKEEKITKIEYYNGLVTTIEVDFVGEITNMAQFTASVRVSFFRLVEMLKIRHTSSYFKLEVRFSPEDQELTQYYLVFNGKGSFDILNPTEFKIGENLVDTVKGKNSESDTWTGDAIFWLIDYQHYRVSIFDLERSGGCGGVHPPPDIRWGKIGDTEIKSKGCFVKILHVFLKEQYRDKSSMIRKIKSNYLTFWKHLDTELGTLTFQDGKNDKLIKVSWAERAATLFAVTLIVHDATGKAFESQLKMRKEEKTGRKIFERGRTLPQESAKILRVLLYKEHFYPITNYKPPFPEKPLISAVVHHHSHVPLKISVYYDLETVYDCDPTSENHLIPYSISYLIGNYATKVKFGYVLRPDKNYPLLFTTMIRELIKQGTAYIARREVKRKETEKHPFFLFYQMIAFNGANFDHHLLFAHLSSAGYPILYAPKTNKIHTFKALLTENIGIEVWDPAAFVSGSLETVAESFNVENKKGKFDHDAMQKAYEEGRFVSYAKNISVRLKEYNDQDVRVLKDIVRTLSNLGLGLLQNSTLASLSYKLFKQTIEKGVAKSLIGFKEQKVQSMVRKSLIGGRTHIRREEGKLIYAHVFPKLGVMVDVVSLYPFVMNERKYPHGSYHFLETESETNKAWEEGAEGLWWCAVDQKPMEGKYHHCILPKLTRERKGAKYAWDTFGDFEGYLPTPTVEDLIIAGANVWFEGAIIWDDFSNIFSTYIKRYKKGKEEEDEKKRRKKPFNPVKRKMYKSLMNSLSGKMCQREFLTTYTYLDFRSEGVAGFISTMKKGIDFDIVSNNGVFIKGERDYVGEVAYPVYLASFIYGYARSYMWRKVFSRMRVWYTDTDSALIDVSDLKLIEPLVVSTKFKKEIGGKFPRMKKKQFGDFEVEEVCTNIYMPASKSYLMLSKGIIVKKRLKGVRNKDQIEINGRVVGALDTTSKEILKKPEELKRNKAAVVNMFETLNRGGHVNMLTWSFRKCFRTGTIRRIAMRKLIKI